MIAAIFIGGCIILLLAYRFYGAFLSRQFGIDDTKATPACTMNDGVDFVPTSRPVLFGHHFSSIAGAGPIVGPILAAWAFGWGPALLWIILGSILIGGVHDFGSLVMSIRHRARSVAEICKLYLSPVTYRFFLIFIWLALVYVLVVFLDLTATGFIAAPADHPAQGGTVATASILYIVMAIAFGLLLKSGKMNLRNGSLIFVPMVFLALFAAAVIPILPESLPRFSAPLDSPKYFWIILLLAYCFAASVLPVWFMLQPRDYLSSFLLFACLGFGGLGMLLGSLTGSLPALQAPFTAFHPGDFNYLFPVLFITVACGACSGFHSIVASGTTAKQLPEENAARPVAYGGMLTEAALALVALATVMIVAGKPENPNPIVAFSAGMGRFLHIFGLPLSMGATFGLMAISTFLLTTLDTCTRLTRYIVEEFLDVQDGRKWRYVTSALALAPLLYFSFKSYEINGVATPAWKVIWPAFGTTNQLLGALSLLVITVWRRSQGRSVWFVMWPMLFMLATTTTSMVMLIVQHTGEGGTPIIGWINGVMLAMTALLVADTVLNWGKLGRRGMSAGLAAADGMPGQN